jgi:RecA-family ATPase
MDGIPPIIPALQSAYDFEREVERELAGEGHKGNGADKAQCSARFKLEDWNDVDFDPNEEWRVEDVLPMRGFGLIYGKPRSFKSFVAMDLAIRVVLGRPWAGKRVAKGRVVYIAAEGAHGMRKRIAAGKMRQEVPRGDFALISTAPNLGTGDGDLPALIAAAESAGINPALIVIDTASKSIGAAEENGAGMAAFVGNAEKLAQHFDCLVLGVHHVGLGEDAQKRPRGWSGLGGALDVQILCERPGDEKRTTLTVQKLKDEEDGIGFEARLSRRRRLGQARQGSLDAHCGRGCRGRRYTRERSAEQAHPRKSKAAHGRCRLRA